MTVDGIDDAISVAIGDNGADIGRRFLVCIHRAAAGAGQVWCFGTAFDGALPGGVATNSPVPILGTDGEPLEGVVDIAVAAATGCALLDTGEVHCWGSNAFGLLGRGSTEPSAMTPGPVPGIP